jgi:carbon monoxide dehydrogenase subunit G
MQMAGRQRVDAARDVVWNALNDPAVLRRAIPGCQNLDTQGEHQFAAEVAVRIGPIGARFKGVVSLTDIEPAKGYTLVLRGNGGIVGSVSGSAKVRLTDDGGATVIDYEVATEVSGRLAQLGGPIVDATAKQLADQFFTRFRELLGGQDKTGVAVAAADSRLAAMQGSPAQRHESRDGPWPGIACVAAAVIGFLLGRSPYLSTSEWHGLVIGLLMVVVATLAFALGRRAAAPVVTVDLAQLRQLLQTEPP